jgi:hypothetical protein
MDAVRNIDQAVIPAALAALGMRSTPELRVELLAIGGQESGLTARAQILNGGGKGPARGLWQFEKGGVRGVYLHRASNEPLRLLCRARDVNFDVPQIWAALETDDILACGVARLLLWTDPRPLPAVDDEEGAWSCYVRNWRPGKPHRDRWVGAHAAARRQVGV